VAAVPRPAQLPPLRAKTLGKLRLESRIFAREATVRAISEASVGISNGRLGALLGGEQAGAQAKTGAVVLTPGEVALLLPLGAASKTMLQLMRSRLLSELEHSELDEKTRFRIQLALTNLDASLVCLADLDAPPAA
jgi:hypothetical protein